MAESSGPDGPADLSGVSDTERIGDDEVRLRDFQPGDEAQILELLRAAFGTFYPSEKPVDEAGYIRWFTEPHDSHRGRIALAEVGDRIACFAAELTRDIRLGDRTWHGIAGGLGAATHPDFRRRGFLSATKRWLAATADPIREVLVDRRTATTGTVSAAPEPFPGEMGVYLYVQRPWRAAREWTEGLVVLDTLLATALALWGRLRSAVGPRGARDVTVRTLPAFDERFDLILEQAQAAWDIVPIRSVEYLNWRFCDPRAGEFKIRAAEEDSGLVGYAVVHAVGSRGHIVDLLVLPGRLDVVRTLVSDAVRELSHAGTAAVECWMLREHPYARALSQAGLVRLPGRSAEVAGEIGWSGPGIGDEQRALLASPDTRTHLVRADFDGI